MSEPAVNPEVIKLERELRLTKTQLMKFTQLLREKESLEQAITSQKKQQEAYTNILLENSPVIIAVTDRDGIYKLCTRSFLNALGFKSYGFVIGRHYRDVLTDSLSPEAVDMIDQNYQQTLNTGEPVRYYSYLKLPIGERYFHFDFNRIPPTDNIDECFIAVVSDSTELEEQKSAAESANIAKSAFLAAMSHEIRTPMNAVIGLNELLARTEVDDKQFKYLVDMKKSADALLGIINDILDFSKVESGKTDIINAPYNLHAMLDHLHRSYERIFAEKDLYFRIIKSDNLPVWVEGDEQRVRQAATNIISNAAKYTKTGGAELTATLEGNFLIFTLKDTGIGIKKEDISRVFSPFERLDLMQNRSVQGTGLGMPISFKYCALMGGSLDFESEYGVGSTFTMKIPYVPAEPILAPSTGENDIFAAPELHVLVVDDIEINVQIAATMLEAFGINADVVLSGKEAIEYCKKNTYDIIFMDHMMPEMDGVETMLHIRKLSKAYENLPIIALTANAANSAETFFLRSGFSGFLSKPLEFSTLARCIKGIFPNL
ncbi:MAG: response regulator [Ruminococcus sp.]|jgi:signal transduction histidine kinase|nr:response regulator [Ruminococcus sp.]